MVLAPGREGGCLDELCRDAGFGSFADVRHLIAQLRVRTPIERRALEDWLELDGTKAGLLTLVKSFDVVHGTADPDATGLE